MSEVNNDKVEALLKDIKEQLDNEATASEVIAKSADTLVAAQVEKFDALSKAVDEISDKLAMVVKAIEAINVPSKEEIDTQIEEKAQEIAKSLDEKVDTIEKTVEAEKAENDELKKKVEELENEPVVKATTVEIDEPIVKTAEVKEELQTRGELIEKALTEIKTADRRRASELFKAISLLEAGASLDNINIKL